jgi:propanol-preferring alcohol dehydrogenase
MRAMILESQRQQLALATLPDPEPGPGQLLLDIHACGVCRTDLHLRDGEIPATKLPVVLGHQIVATTADGRRVGVPWLGWTDGTCEYCTSGRENLCVHARFTGRDVDGGYAELTVADERFCLPLPEELSDQEAAPLLCGGLIGYRALTFAFTRPGDERTQAFARGLGASWAGGSDEPPPEPLEAAIIFAPAGPLVPKALEVLAPDGVVVCAGIHMSDIPSFPYELLYHERKVRSVANLTRRDGEEFIAIAPKVPIKTTVATYELERAEEALADLRAGRFEGTAVIVP